LGRVGRWRWWLQLLLPLLLVAALWLALHPLLARLEITARAPSLARLVAQGLLVGVGVLISLKYVLPVFLLLHLIVSYVYLGASPIWEFVSTTARNLLAPLRPLPLRLARFDFAPVFAVVVIFLLLHWLPLYLLNLLARRQVNLWPQ
jgi:uncharacterized protein YggT (Ycf19 family)